MSLLLILFIVVAANALAIGAMLLFRSRASPSFNRDSDHSNAALQVSGTVFAVMVGFVFLIAFQSYGNARGSSQTEASATEAMFDLATFFPDQTTVSLRGDLVCYGRSVIADEWPRMEDGDSSPAPETDDWVDVMSVNFEAAPRASTQKTAAGGDWFTQNDAREAARHERLGESEALVPTTVWILLLLGAGVLVAFTLHFADLRESRVSQALNVAAVTTLVTSGLLTIAFLDNAYGEHRGAIQPTAMRESVAAMEELMSADDLSALPCDSLGRPS